MSLCTLEEIAETIIETLKKKNVLIQRYDSFSTNSIYLKLDYGLGYTIRISDHKGKKDLYFRYNIGPYIAQYSTGKNKNGDERYYYPVGEEFIEMLINRVLETRNGKISRYGEMRYFQKMRRRKSINKRKRNKFWQLAELI